MLTSDCLLVQTLRAGQRPPPARAGGCQIARSLFPPPRPGGRGHWWACGAGGGGGCGARRTHRTLSFCIVRQRPCHKGGAVPPSAVVLGTGGRRKRGHRSGATPSCGGRLLFRLPSHRGASRLAVPLGDTAALWLCRLGVSEPHPVGMETSPREKTRLLPELGWLPKGVPARRVCTRRSTRGRGVPRPSRPRVHEEGK